MRWRNNQHDINDDINDFDNHDDNLDNLDDEHHDYDDHSSSRQSERWSCCGIGVHLDGSRDDRARGNDHRCANVHDAQSPRSRTPHHNHHHDAANGANSCRGRSD